jgi:hypothetical protein
MLEPSCCNIAITLIDPAPNSHDLGHGINAQSRPPRNLPGEIKRKSGS